MTSLWTFDESICIRRVAGTSLQHMTMCSLQWKGILPSHDQVNDEAGYKNFSLRQGNHGMNGHHPGKWIQLELTPVISPSRMDAVWRQRFLLFGTDSLEHRRLPRFAKCWIIISQWIKEKHYVYPHTLYKAITITDCYFSWSNWWVKWGQHIMPPPKCIQ